MRCEKCIQSSTRPDLSFDGGICDACKSAEAKEKIDWIQREQELKILLEKYKGTGYDCIVPVSGGKDSTFQILKLLEYGMHPLAVTFGCCESTEEGKHNMFNIAELGLDHILITLNRKVYRELFRIGFRDIGDACWPCHSGIFTAPIKLAVLLGIPLIVYGENPHTEYGGPNALNSLMSEDWLKNYGGLCGLFAEDIKGVDKRDLYWFEMPDKEALKKISVIYLGHYIKWDARKQLEIVKKHGFIKRKKKPANAYLDYENVDCGFVDMHDHLMYKKFGFGRATTQLAIDVRNGRISREKALKIAAKLDPKSPDFKKFAKFTGLSIKDIKKNISNYTRR